MYCDNVMDRLDSLISDHSIHLGMFSVTSGFPDKHGIGVPPKEMKRVSFVWSLMAQSTLLGSC